MSVVVRDMKWALGPSLIAMFGSLGVSVQLSLVLGFPVVVQMLLLLEVYFLLIILLFKAKEAG